MSFRIHQTAFIMLGSKPTARKSAAALKRLIQGRLGDKLAAEKAKEHQTDR
jgi:hypothetical protein